MEDPNVVVQPEPVAPVAPVEDTANLFEGTSVNPDELHADLQPLAKQLQAAFTQKTQKIAEQQKQMAPVFDLGVDPGELVSLYSRVADPAQWPALAAELAEAAAQRGVDLGFTPNAAPAAPEQPEPVLHGLEIPDDPELAPLTAELLRQRKEIDSFRAEREQEGKAREAEALQNALVGEFTRMETSIRQAKPEYDDEDMDDVYELSSFHGGDLLKAQTRKESIEQRAVERYIARKQADAGKGSVTPAPAGASATSAVPPKFRTLKEAEAEAIDFFNARLGDEDFSLVD